MQITSRFTIAVHILACVKYFEGKVSLTSEFLAGSIGVNPVIVRQIISKLKSAGIIISKHGKGGLRQAGNLDEVTLFDIYKAVEAVSDEGLFRFHENPNPDCPVGRKIHDVLDGSLKEIQRAFEDSMKNIRLREIL